MNLSAVPQATPVNSDGFLAMHIPILNSKCFSFSDYEALCDGDDAVAISPDNSMVFYYIGDWDMKNHKDLTVQANEIMKAFCDKGFHWVRIDTETGMTIPDAITFEWGHLLDKIIER